MGDQGGAPAVEQGVAMRSSQPREAASEQEDEEKGKLIVGSDEEDFVVRIPRRNCGAGILCLEQRPDSPSQSSSGICMVIVLMIGLSVNNSREGEHADGQAWEGQFAPEVVYSAAGSAPAPGSPPAKACTLSDVSWMHIPRNGLSFALVIIGCGCPTLPLDQFPEHQAGTMNLAAWSWKHQLQYCPQLGSQLLGRQEPLRERPANTGLNWMAMIRDPRRRLVSAFKDHLNAWGFNRHEHEEMRGRVRTLIDVVSYPGIPGCQARMLLGMRCADTSKPSLYLEEEMEALTRVGQMAFIGITDHWELSVKLFHATFGGETGAEDLVKLKPSGGNDGDMLQLSEDTDTSDWKVYVGAVQLFVDRVKSKLPGEPIPRELAEIASFPHLVYP